ncbi:MAG: hypothetical protein KatS3mg022_1244 [Armatimonadota bacterium]|nr:MAG: hypothetical protein KatS3mg022_1244 [Armatimonadota bacterium]
MWAANPIYSAVIVLLVVLCAVRLHWLSVSGAAAAFVVGWVTLAGGGWQGTAVLLTFFVTSSVLSRWRAAHKKRMEFLTARGSQRGATQVLANGGVASLCIALYTLTGEACWWLAFVGAYTAANADTWSSEIGALSTTPPRHILTGRILRAGDSGGVTSLGFLAGGAGSVVIAGIAWLVHPMPLAQALVVALGGMAGNLLDSLLGATLQARYRCKRCGEVVEKREHCGLAATQLSGWRWINNDMVNLLCTLAGALITLLSHTAIR